MQVLFWTSSLDCADVVLCCVSVVCCRSSLGTDIVSELWSSCALLLEALFGLDGPCSPEETPTADTAHCVPVLLRWRAYWPCQPPICLVPNGSLPSLPDHCCGIVQRHAKAPVQNRSSSSQLDCLYSIVQQHAREFAQNRSLPSSLTVVVALFSDIYRGACLTDLVFLAEHVILPSGQRGGGGGGNVPTYVSYRSP